MRRVVLYTLQATEMAVSGPDVLLHRAMAPLADMLRLPNDDFAMPVRGDMKVVRLPVHHIHECRAPSEELLHPLYPLCSPPKVREHYIAMEPALREILEAPLLEQVREARQEKAFAAGRAAGLESRIALFQSRPWWARMWRALRGEVS